MITYVASIVKCFVDGTDGVRARTHAANGSASSETEESLIARNFIHLPQLLICRTNKQTSEMPKMLGEPRDPMTRKGTMNIGKNC